MHYRPILGTDHAMYCYLTFKEEQLQQNVAIPGGISLFNDLARIENAAEKKINYERN